MGEPQTLKNGFRKFISSILRFAEFSGEIIFVSDQKWQRCCKKTWGVGSSRPNEHLSSTEVTGTVSMQMRKYLEMDYDDINNSRYMFLLAEEHTGLDWLFEPVMRAINVPAF